VHLGEHTHSITSVSSLCCSSRGSDFSFLVKKEEKSNQDGEQQLDLQEICDDGNTSDEMEDDSSM
jgi:hypothetical protein